MPCGIVDAMKLIYTDTGAVALVLVAKPSAERLEALARQYPNHADAIRAAVDKWEE